jgi:hypothetical protein
VPNQAKLLIGLDSLLDPVQNDGLSDFENPPPTIDSDMTSLRAHG